MQLLFFIFLNVGMRRALMVMIMVMVVAFQG